MTFRSRRSRSNPENFEVVYLENGTDREMLSIEVKQGIIYGLSNGVCFYPKWPIGVKGQGQTLKTLKSNISKTVRDREMVSIEVK